MPLLSNFITVFFTASCSFCILHLIIIQPMILQTLKLFQTLIRHSVTLHHFSQQVCEYSTRIKSIRLVFPKVRMPNLTCEINPQIAQQKLMNGNNIMAGIPNMGEQMDLQLHLEKLAVDQTHWEWTLGPASSMNECVDNKNSKVLE